MRTVLVLLAFLAIPAFAAQVVWKWVDGDGVTHYSDRPVPGATRMEISSGGERSATSAPTPSFSSGSPQKEAQEGPTYRNFEIWKPADGEIFINTGGAVPVNIRVEPALQAGHELNLYLDGRLVEGFEPSATSYELKEVPRGSHRRDRGHQRSTRCACARDGASRFHGASGIHCESPCWSRAASAAQANSTRRSKQIADAAARLRCTQRRASADRSGDQPAGSQVARKTGPRERRLSTRRPRVPRAYQAPLRRSLSGAG